MTHYPALGHAGHRDRRVRGWAIAEAGGNITDFARAEGVSTAAVWKWLQMWPELYRALLDGRNQSELSGDEADYRLRTVALSDIAGRSRSSAARELGLSPPGLLFWLRRRQCELQDMINEIEAQRPVACKTYAKERAA